MKERIDFIKLLPLLTLGIFALFSSEGKAQGCTVSFPQDTVSIQCGDSTTLSPIDGSTQLGDDFNDSSLDSGWSSNQTVDYYSNLSCLEDPVNDGTPFGWMGPNATQPRNLTTSEMNVSCGGNLCFDLIMGSENMSGDPCEGPDQDDEGVYLQYSIDNGTSWNTIFYFNPDTVCCGCGGAGCGGEPPSPFVGWGNYCFPIPPAAQTDTTQFRWWQSAGSGQDFDHWGLDNVVITGASCDSIQAYSYDGTNFDSIGDTTVGPTNNTTYTVWGISDTSAGGDTCSGDVYVNVTGVPDLTVTASDSAITCTDSIQLNASHNTGGSITYDWTPDYQISDPGVQDPTAWPFMDTTYQVIAYSNGSPACADTGSVPIIVDCDTCFSPHPNLIPPSCNGDSDGMVVADLIGPRPPYNVVWEDGSGNVLAQDSPVTATDTLTGLTAGQYTITTTDTMNCSADTTFMLPEPDSILANISNDTTICQGGTAQVAGTASGGNGPPYQYNWNQGLPDTDTHSVSPSSATVYELTTEDSNGCVSPMVSTMVDVHPPIFVNAMPDDTICPGGTAQLEVLTTNGGSGSGYSYTWTNGAGDTIGTGPITNVQPSTTMSYVVHVGDDCESPLGTDTVTISIYQGQAGPDVNMAVVPQEGCAPVEADFTCLVPSNKVQSTFWSFGDGTTSNDSGTTSHSYLDPGCYDVTLEVTSTNGCIEDSTFQDAVCVRPYPDADFVTNPERGTVLDPVLFLEDRSSGAVGYEWSFEHLDSTSSLPSLEMEFPNREPGSYEVEQWVVNQYGCADSITKTIVIEGVHQLYVPNAFTPDGDGHNDIFRPEGEGIAKEKYRFKIFDRWGHQVFMTKDPEEGWDGTFNGEKARSGVYVWQVQVKDAYTGKVHNKQGHVTLIR